MKVAIYNNKGGVGKSTLVCHTAFRAAEQKKDLTVIDADGQHNTMSWLSNHTWNNEEAFDMGSVYVTTNVRDNGNGLTIIDTPPADNVTSDIPNVDVWVVPVNGRFSVDGAINVIESVRKSDKNARVVLAANMSEPQTKFGKTELEQIRKLDVELFESPIPSHPCVRKAEMLGVPAWKVPYGIRSSTAQNLQYFADWVLHGCKNMKNRGY